MIASGIRGWNVRYHYSPRIRQRRAHHPITLWSRPPRSIYASARVLFFLLLPERVAGLWYHKSMPFLSARSLRLCPSSGAVLTCNKHDTSTFRRLDSPLSHINPSASSVFAPVQTRILRTTARSSLTTLPATLSSPHQWSHIVHGCRNPRTSGLLNSMAGWHRHMGHSHGHGGHSHDNTYLTSANKADAGVKITRAGLYVNLGMAIAKGTGGYVFNSQALTADAVHSLTDLISDVATLATISYSIRLPTSQFPLGYGKVESLGALAVSGLLLSGGIMIGLQAVMALSQQFFPGIAEVLSHSGIFEHAHDHSHSHVDIGPNINAAWLAGGSIFIKEWLYRATMKIAKQKRSSVLASNAYHHRVDSLTAFVALLTICASHFFTGAQWLDPVGGLIISGMIIQAGWGNTKSAFLELADVAMDDDMQQSVRTSAATALEEAVGGTASIRGVQGIKSGQNFLVEIEVAAPTTWTLAYTNEVEDAIRQNVGRTRGVRRVTVRFVDSDTERSRRAEMATPETDDTGTSRLLASDPEMNADRLRDSRRNGDRAYLMCVKSAASYVNPVGLLQERSS
nr:mitochondrial metal transporter 2 [Quercus suber]